jgi:hypothetical protein
MKTNTATLKVMVIDRPSKDGMYPIILRAFWHGRADKRTGISVPLSAWSEKTGSIKSSYPNASKLNKVIQSMYAEALSRKIELESKGPIKDVHDIFKDTPVSNLNYLVLTTNMIKDRSLSFRSSQCYLSTYHGLCEFMGKRDIDITELNQDRIMSYGRYLKNKGLKNSSIIGRLYNICAIWKYAIDNELVGAELDPFRKFNPRRVYEADVTKKALNKPDYDRIENMLYDTIMSHRDNMEVFSKPTTDEFALACFVLGYVMGGLAFVDLSNIKKSQIITKTINKGTYYTITGVVRQKTNRPVPIIFKKDMLVAPIMEYFLKLEGDHLLPIGCHTGNPVKDRNRLYSVEKSVNHHLRKVTGYDITYYACRHTYSSVYMSQEGANPVHLATMLGRSVNGIFRYVKTITRDVDILHERARMGL